MTLPDGLAPPPDDLDLDELKRAAECILLVSGGPVTVEQLSEVLQAPVQTVHALLWELQQDYRGRGLQVQAVAGGFQLCTRPELAGYVQRYLGLDFRQPLSQAALETLAIVAYRQPVTRAEIEAIRGVRSDHVLERLLERRLIREVGRKQAVGRPILYGTTEGFLRYFGLGSLDDLPPLGDHDLRAALDGLSAASGRDD
ncbi:MAG: SMC-Scp complex subunit ScpB [Armatimonadota bacterium]|nr:SMC-Scp complex subunit ScpB [Armatimonadota bacterium]MDR7400662.1 SMC-Scp complex subunit ScpB [Armatimonadota bacterium]MDR7403190.1 SMC-Scp complex subunit ScpB [Armatimonadota bacterium]MDR7436527.1 SMC-Scp complex subunit ScpB [Armatimonadota bacterium]MDR7472562.1 SMC-Scp complex subunit ScpB [Armatimonadota bacterium]